MPRCTRHERHQGDCEHRPEDERYWEIVPEDGYRCDFHIVVMPYNDFLDKFESRDE